MRGMCSIPIQQASVPYGGDIVSHQRDNYPGNRAVGLMQAWTNGTVMRNIWQTPMLVVRNSVPEVANQTPRMAPYTPIQHRTGGVQQQTVSSLVYQAAVAIRQQTLDKISAQLTSMQASR